MVALVHLALVLPACSPQTGDSDAGEAGGATGTVLDQCTRIANAFCTHAINRCGELLVDCVNEFNGFCCGPANGSSCTAPAITPDSQITACANAFASMTCAQIAQRLTPPACANVPEVP